MQIFFVVFVYYCSSFNTFGRLSKKRQDLQCFLQEACFQGVRAGANVASQQPARERRKAQLPAELRFSFLFIEGPR